MCHVKVSRQKGWNDNENVALCLSMELLESQYCSLVYERPSVLQCEEYAFLHKDLSFISSMSTIKENRWLLHQGKRAVLKSLYSQYPGLHNSKVTYVKASL
jgi:hypothetical protein